MAVLRFDKRVGALPDPLTPDTVYFQRTGAGIDIRVSDSTGAVAHGLNAPAKTAATLTHTAGAVTLDVQAADLYRFEADVYVAGEVTVVGSVPTTSWSSTSKTITLPGGVLEGDVVLVFYGHPAASATLTINTPGYTNIFQNSTNTAFGVWEKTMGATPDTEVSLEISTFFGNTAAMVLVLRNVDASQTTDTASQYAANFDVGDPPAITTVTDGALVLAIVGVEETISTPFTLLSGYTFAAHPYQDGMAFEVQHKSVASAGVEDPGTMYSSFKNTFRGTMAIRPAASSGEADYTITLSNIPSSGIASGLIDIELKTDTGSVAFAGGTVTWIGATPAFNAVGRYLIGFIADSTGITLWREA